MMCPSHLYWQPAASHPSHLIPPRGGIRCLFRFPAQGRHSVAMLVVAGYGMLVTGHIQQEITPHGPPTGHADSILARLHPNLQSASSVDDSTRSGLLLFQRVQQSIERLDELLDAFVFELLGGRVKVNPQLS